MVESEKNNWEEAKLIIPLDKFKSILSERIDSGQGIIMSESEIYNDDDFQFLNDTYDGWTDYNFEFLKNSFSYEENTYVKSYLQAGKHALRSHTGKENEIEFKEKIRAEVKNLRQLYRKAEILKIDKRAQPKMDNTSEQNELSSDIFIVHGHNESIKQSVARMIEKLGLNPIILHEEANVGKTIIEKFESHADVSFAIVLLTNDDKGGAKTASELQPRARQNVIFEFGYFCGKLGRNRVCALYEKGVEMPSDMHGFITIPIDSAGSWKLRVVKEMKAVGFDVDANLIV